MEASDRPGESPAPATGSVKEGQCIRLLIADDHMIARAGLGAILNAHSDMIVVAEASNGFLALALYRQCLPDVVVMDMRMPVMSGLEASLAILREFPSARIVALSTYGGEDDIRRALKSGVHAYLTKDVPHDELIQAIRDASEGRKYLSASLADLLNAGTSRPDLSPRELDVLKLIVQGSQNKEIGWILGISLHTVKTHVKRILEKLDVDDRTEAATAAIQLGMVHLQN